jgi:integrase
MSLYKRGGVWWYEFCFSGRRIRESTKTSRKTLARMAEQKRRRDLEEGFNNVSRTRRIQRVQTVKEAAEIYFREYSVRHPASTPRYMHYCINHLVDLLGPRMLIDVTSEAVSAYQMDRLYQGASGKTINHEVGELLRILGDPGDMLRIQLKKEKKLRLKERVEVGRALNSEEEAAMLEGASKATSPFLFTAIAIALNTAMRDSEIKNITFRQVDLQKKMFTVGKSKTAQGQGRTIPIVGELERILHEYRNWYEMNIATPLPDHFLFPFGRARHWQPTKAITSFKTAWKNLKIKTGIKIRFHDLRHTAITKLAESGAGDETIMQIAGHVSRRMLSNYSHIRTEAKRTALESISTKPINRLRRVK